MDLNFLIHMQAFSVSMGNLFVLCYFGLIASESYEKMSTCLYESIWYEHPVESQKYLVLMVQNIQKPIYYSGFGISNLELEKFTDVSRTTVESFRVQIIDYWWSIY